MNNTAKLVISIIVPLAIGATSGLFTETGVGSWYQTIQKPSWNPPGWIFGPVWTTLYILMGISLYLIWKSDATCHWLGFSGDHCFMAVYPGYDFCLRQNQQYRCLAAGAIYQLGEFRWDIDLYDLETELRGEWLVGNGEWLVASG